MECIETKPFSIPDLVYLERFVNSGTRSYSRLSGDSKLPRIYRPEAEETSFFEISVFRLPREWVECTVANPSAVLHNYFIHDNGQTVSFAVHPVAFMVEGEDKPPWLHLLTNAQAHSESQLLKVAPSASSRTLFVLDSKSDNNDQFSPFALKCHCPVRISRYYRHFESRTVRHAILMSADLEQSGIAILPETIGIALPNTEDGKCGWGFIVREMTPRPVIVDRKTKLIPGFSLYGHDIHDLEGEPLLVKLIRNQSKKNAIDYVLDYIMVPIIRNFCKAFLHLGILLEAHGQNILLEIDANTYEPIRIVHRDFDMAVNSTIRNARGLQTESYDDVKLQNNMIKNQPEENWLSMIYDSSIGHHHFTYLANLLRDYFSVPETLVQEQCQKAFAAAFPNSNDYFPKEVHYYADTPVYDDIYPVVSTGKKPVWRPS